MNFLIQIQNEHLLECSRLYVKVFNAEPWNDEWTLETAYKRLHDIYASTNFEGVLYVEDGHIKGAILGNYEQFYDGIHYNLKEMFIDHELQGTGKGSKMLAKLEEQLKGLGITTIFLFTSKETSKFYLKKDFREWDSLSIMGKEI